MPIHCWAVEHEGVLRLVDTGETAEARDVPFARMEVTREQELPAAMAAAGLRLDDVSEVVLTHAHGDHIDGLVHVRGRVLINETELRFLGSPMARAMRRLLRQPLPPGFAPEPFVLDGGPFGAFPRSRNLSERWTDRCRRDPWAHAGSRVRDLCRRLGPARAARR